MIKGKLLSYVKKYSNPENIIKVKLQLDCNEKHKRHRNNSYLTATKLNCI